jgi:hypothetical protein
MLELGCKSRFEQVQWFSNSVKWFTDLEILTEMGLKT